MIQFNTPIFRFDSIIYLLHKSLIYLILFTPMSKPYKLAELIYKYNALEPYIDTETMETHHLKHHAGYVAGTNTILEKVNQGKDLHEVIEEITKLKAQFNQADYKLLLLMCGGHYNHSLYFKMMLPPSKKKAEELIDPSLLKMIEKQYKTLSNLIDLFATKALSVVGSGWIWLCLVDEEVSAEYGYETGTITGAVVDVTKKIEPTLVLVMTKNQESPMMYSKAYKPLLCMDVWKHAYYLKHKSQRKAYVYDFFKVVNWDFVSVIYREIRDGKKQIGVDYDGEVVFKDVAEESHQTF
ncbi:SODM [Enterospora canceri]|uniref:superoxide dismutase n=1 Tax=Enterospora canceri TaxID=1081671 RepID=A0A1Y1S791_9MICR|nr:SODM [Enterospora canceri]